MKKTTLPTAMTVLSALVFASPPARAAVTEAWVHRYNNVMSNSIDQAVKVVRDTAGDIIVTGTTDDRMTGQVMLTIKYSGADGSVLWQKRYTNGSAQALAVDVTGNVLVTGYSATLKYAAADGALVWEQRSSGAGEALVVDDSGNVLVTGYADDSHYTAKYAAADGALLWEKRYYEGQAAAVTVDGGGNVVVTGSTYAYRGLQAMTAEDHQNNRDYYTAKYASGDGALLWEKRFNGPANHDDRAQAVAVDGGNNVVVTGYADGDYYTAKYATADGALLWEQRYANGAATAVAVDGGGNVVVTGRSATIKYASTDGALLWENRFNDAGEAVAVDSNGNVVVSGSSFGTNYYSDFYTATYAAADGALLWEQRYTNGSAAAVAVDGRGDVVMTGSSGQWPDYDYYTAEYAAADGALLWEQRYNGLVNGNDFPNAVAVDRGGTVLVTGYSSNGTNDDYYTAKYAATDGALLWEQRYNGPANRDDRVYSSRSLAVGPNGMVAVTGSSSGDYATVVYRDDVYPISIALIPTGVHLRFTGIPSRSYTIERAPAVTGPWTAINTQTAAPSGLLEHLDAPPPPGSAFYRTVQP